MNVGVVTRSRPQLRAVRQSLWPCCAQAPAPQRRHESSFRRTTKRLRVKPDASFLPSSGSPDKDHIVFNPPSSAPSVYHTPLTFLPREDRRRAWLSPRQEQSASASSSSKTTTISSSTPSSPSAPQPHLPKPLSEPYEKKYHLGTKEIEEIRRLRLEQPEVNTANALAKKFDCSPLFVSIICQAPVQQWDRETAKLEEVKSRWGRRRRTAREDRVKRRELWGRGDEA
ncbi:MAG: hypothetical protein M4579_002165 [Chaenotheca gracillima]|nr:MAG: hypothetical protein M4579_002165 [Chaenotheca gracillima]